jgi:hypothetical protein
MKLCRTVYEPSVWGRGFDIHRAVVHPEGSAYFFWAEAPRIIDFAKDVELQGRVALGIHGFTYPETV